MPRRLRILYKNAWYHVINRGLNKNNIFHSNKHKYKFIHLLSEITQLFSAQIHAYCLLDNHYHLLVRTPKANLPQIMKRIDGIYTQYLNNDVKRDGPIFKGRYRAILIEAENYLLQVSRYIHLNPIKAGIIKNAEAYYWSSYRFYINNKNKPEWLCTKTILDFFGNSQQPKSYSNFIKQGLDKVTQEFYDQKNPLNILGRPAFIIKTLKKSQR